MPRNNSFVVGDTVKLRVESRVADVLTDPTGITLKIEEPDGVDVAPSVTNDATGKHSATLAPDQVGKHYWRWDLTGTAAGRTEGEFYVHSSPIVDD